MVLRDVRWWLLGSLVVACEAPSRNEPAAPPRHTPPTEAAIGEAALAAVAAGPWDSDPTGWRSLCTPDAPCDTIVIDPRVVVLPAQAPAFFVPDRRDVAARLSAYTLTLTGVPGRR